MTKKKSGVALTAGIQPVLRADNRRTNALRSLGFPGLTPSALALDCIFLFFVKSESLARRKPKQVY